VRFATLRTDGTERAAVLVPGRGYAPLGAVDASLPDDLVAALSGGLPADLPMRAAGLDDARLIPIGRAAFGALLRRPRKLLGIGLNYREHAGDLEAPLPDEPASFLKGDHTIIGPGAAILLPPQSRRVTAEAELGLVIGRECWRVDRSTALEYVAGVVPVLDQTAEDILRRNPRFLTRAKNFPTFLSIGPELVTLDEAGTLEDLEVATVRNGTVHRANTVADMLVPPAELVAFHSHVMPLYPGDVISTGTPGAVVIEDGDEVECRISGIGVLRNSVVAAGGTSWRADATT
jgi:2-keto-4-pentenoate hydratase/2-oxohepta-3-ene-1,7-dioic acid hydratase in catechol pathway